MEGSENLGAGLGARTPFSEQWGAIEGCGRGNEKIGGVLRKDTWAAGCDITMGGERWSKRDGIRSIGPARLEEMGLGGRHVIEEC